MTMSIFSSDTTAPAVNLNSGSHALSEIPVVGLRPLRVSRFHRAAAGSMQDLASDMSTDSAIPTILLVEDNAVNQVVALEFLALMGVHTRLASTGAEALAACTAAAPDLVLMDIQMPGMDGLECTRRLRSLQAAGQLAPFPILALTAHALDSDIKASLEAGMDEHLTKPLDFKSLRHHLGRWVKLPD
nr:response regulator [uncultured Roseateles sp.]